MCAPHNYSIDLWEHILVTLFLALTALTRCQKSIWNPVGPQYTFIDCKMQSSILLRHYVTALYGIIQWYLCFVHLETELLRGGLCARTQLDNVPIEPAIYCLFSSIWKAQSLFCGLCVEILTSDLILLFTCWYRSMDEYLRGQSSFIS